MSENDMAIPMKDVNDFHIDNKLLTENLVTESRYRSVKTQYETLKEISYLSKKKTLFSLPQLIVLGIIGGIYVGFGGLFALTAAGGIDTTTAANHPSIQKLLIGLTFPVGLILIVLAGAELFTSNILIMTIGLLSRKVKLVECLKVILVSYLMNYLGTTIVCAFILLYGEFLQTSPFKEYIHNIGVSKVYDSSFGVLILKSIPANMLVCLAVMMATSADDVAGKILAIFLPISTFAAVGMEHVIANEFFVQAAIFIGAPVNYGAWLWRNFIPVTIGNTIGGLVLGLIYWYVYLAEENLGKNHPLITFKFCCRQNKEKDIEDP